jgi:hypothetical protein
MVIICPLVCVCNIYYTTVQHLCTHFSQKKIVFRPCSADPLVPCFGDFISIPKFQRVTGLLFCHAAFSSLAVDSLKELIDQPFPLRENYISKRHKSHGNQSSFLRVPGRDCCPPKRALSAAFRPDEYPELDV